MNLEGARVLEVGCGTGSSTVALAAHADFVLACDIHLPSINAALIRLKEDGFAHKVNFLHIQPGSSEPVAHDEEFDVVILYGVVEHMLPSEREQLFRNVWKLLRSNGKLVLYETPNRLWPKDRHTTGLVGWSWLPPDWALWYGKRRGALDPETDLVRMYRLGFGLSYRELVKRLKECEARYAVRFKYTREPFYQRAVIKTLTTLIRTPRWGFSENLNLVIEKL